MVGCFPEEMAEVLEARCPPERVHTIVIWSKDPRNMLDHPRLHRVLARYDQLYLHWTVTGMGGTPLECRVPPWENLMDDLPRIIDFLGTPERLRLRFDPIVHLKLPSGEVYTNFPLFPKVAGFFARWGVRDVSLSWMEAYPKVVRRLKRVGLEPAPLPHEQWLGEVQRLREWARVLGLTLHFCCVPRLPQSHCIDGELLSRLHPKGYRCSTQRAKGQRPLCGCTESWDIGWYNPCPNGCLYCYANPAEVSPSQPLTAEQLTA